MGVIFLTEGGSNIGFGHISRCLALGHAFQEAGASCEFIVNADDKVKDTLSPSKYNIFDWLSEPERVFKILAGANLVIIDSYLADLEFYQKIAGIARSCVYIDDNKRLDYPKGVVLNSAIYAKDIDYPKKKEVTYLLGPEYALLRKELGNVLDKKINKDIHDILITFGGTDHSDLIQKICSYLGERFDFSFKCINKENRVDSKTFLNLIFESDICISAGGQTTYELARLGTPGIGVCLADNQLMNLEKWNKVGFLEFAGWYNDKNLLEKIAESLQILKPYPERAKRADIGRSYIDGQGANRVVEAILSYAKN